MHELSYRLSFNTPAFLGNADQVAQWRTPPIKALIRQWWRVVKAPQLGRDVDSLRRAEAKLFGNAADDGPTGSQQSALRIRLDSWADGTLRQWPSDEPREFHSEVGRPVGTELYLGYGPLDYDKISKQARLGTSKSSGVQRTAIDDKARAVLRLRLPAEAAQEVEASLQLAQWFGTLGSRARNAWGSLQLERQNGPALQALSAVALASYLRPLRQCLEHDWPHAIGCDALGPLVWMTPGRNSWREVMKDLARLKIDFRTQCAPFPQSPPGALEGRHLMGYPVTHHDVQLPGWGRNGRIPDELSLWQAVHRMLHEQVQKNLLSRLDWAMSSTFWKRKLAAWLHDPAEKALVLMRDVDNKGQRIGHENASVAALRTALEIRKSDFDKRADHYAAAADRPQWPFEDGRSRPDWANVRFVERPDLAQRCAEGFNNALLGHWP